MARRHDKVVNPLAGDRASPRRAARLVVGAARVVDRVVEPDRELDIARMLGEGTQLVETREALLEVLERVIAPSGYADPRRAR